MSTQLAKKDAQARAQALKAFYEAHDDALFSQDTIAQVRDCSRATMERDRWAGGGIPFIKLGRAVRYRKSDALAWLAKPTQTSTSEVAV
ncbi:helix-turn-helix transcriptional regulator [Methylobacter psychrophilus]|uniref:helix-turn-helix transcriptional regulator n=1 Tax=Methylobacter psychrophilus TaxID=96941 RepID=UPI0021D48C1E|nr:helix-turn-helix domain-containing protein [Methylobacter psychrophilus]